MEPTNNDDNNSPAKNTTTQTTPQSNSPILSTTLNVTSPSPAISSLTTYSARSVGNLFVRLQSSIHKPKDEGDGGESDRYFDDEVDDEEKNQISGFITESNEIQTQNIVKDVN